MAGHRQPRKRRRQPLGLLTPEQLLVHRELELLRVAGDRCRAAAAHASGTSFRYSGGRRSSRQRSDSPPTSLGRGAGSAAEASRRTHCAPEVPRTRATRARWSSRSIARREGRAREPAAGGAGARLSTPRAHPLKRRAAGCADERLYLAAARAGGRDGRSTRLSRLRPVGGFDLRGRVPEPLVEVFDGFRSGSLLAVDADAALHPFAHRLPVLRLLTPHGRLPVHLDHRDDAELVDQRGPDRVHLGVVLAAHASNSSSADANASRLL